jgi:tRNA pseudouridine55 synthase
VEREARPVRIDAYDLLAMRPGERCEIDVTVSCGKGTYIRSLAVDLGERLGVGGHVSALRRSAVGPFLAAQAISLDTLEALSARGELAAMDALLQPLDVALPHLPLLKLPESSGFYLSRGQPVLVPNAPCDGMVRLALETGSFLGLGEILDDGRVAPRRLVVTGR